MTAARFQQLWAALPTNVWGAGDGSTSYKLPDGRVLWLYGDTFEPNSPYGHPFVHSTAITQTGGCLHVSYNGAQVLPNDVTHAWDATAQHYYDTAYWIETFKAGTGGYGTITARRMLTYYDAGPWGFKDLGTDRTASVQVTSYGNVKFLKWVSSVTSPAKPGVFADCPVGYDQPPPPKHFCYNPASHPEQKLSSGQTLWTVNQGWDDGRLHPVEDYRPIFYEGSPA